MVRLSSMSAAQFYYNLLLQSSGAFECRRTQTDHFVFASPKFCLADSFDLSPLYVMRNVYLWSFDLLHM